MSRSVRGPMFLIILLVLTLCYGILVLADTSTSPSFVESVPVYKQSSVVDVREACEVAGTSSYCPATTNCNITIFSPNATMPPVIDNQPMQRNAAFYNFTLNTSQTAVLGFYPYNIACTDSSLGVNGIDSFQFEITPSGTRPSTAQGIMYFVLMIVSTFFFVLDLYFGYTIQGGNSLDMYGFAIVNYKKYIKFFLWGLAYLILLWLSYLAWMISQNFLFLGFSTAFFELMTNLLLFPGSVLFGIALFVLILKCIIVDSKLEQMTRRGLRPRK